MRAKILLSVIVLLVLTIFIYHSGRKIAYDLFLNIGTNLEEKEDIAGTINALEKAAAFLRSQSSIYARVGDVGIREYDAILVKGKESKLGKEESLDISARNFMESLRYNPQNPWAWSGLSEYFERRAYLVEKPDVINISKLPYGDRGKLGYEDWVSIGAAGKALTLEPNNYFYHDLLGFILQENGLRQEALNHYKTAVMIMPNTALHFFLPSAGSMPEDMYQAILDGLDNALRENALMPEHWTHRYSAFFLRDYGPADKAAHHFEEAALLTNECALLYSNYCEAGRMYIDLGQYDKAVSFLEKSIIGDPKPYTFYSLAEAQSHAGNHAKAIENLKKAILLKSDVATFYRRIGEEYLHEGNWVEAEKNLLKAIELCPSKPEAYKKLVGIYQDHQMHDKAYEYLEKLKKVSSNSK